MKIVRTMDSENALRGQGVQFPALTQLGADLLRIAPFQPTCSLASLFAWFGAYFLFAWIGLWPLAVVATMVLSFITYGSVSHDLVHRNLGLSRRATITRKALTCCIKRELFEECWPRRLQLGICTIWSIIFIQAFRIITGRRWPNGSTRT